MSDTLFAANPPAATPFKVTGGIGEALAEELIHLPVVARYGASLFMVGLTTAAALAVERLAAPSNMALFFVAPVVLAATAFGWGPSLAAVGAGVLAFDFFFTAPRYSLEISSPSDIWAAGLLLAIAAIVSGVAAVTRRKVEQARDDAMRAEALRALAHKVVEGDSCEEIVEASAATLSLIFQAPAVVFADRNGAVDAVAWSGGARIYDGEVAAARDVARRLVPTRGETYPFPLSAFDFWPIATRKGRRYVLGVDFKHAAAPRPSAPERSVDMVAACLAGVA
jgi:two-component system sensor histidine kinase KdpD